MDGVKKVDIEELREAWESKFLGCRSGHEGWSAKEDTSVESFKGVHNDHFDSQSQSEYVTAMGSGAVPTS
jgi:hypothetical protein